MRWVLKATLAAALVGAAGHAAAQARPAPAAAAGAAIEFLLGGDQWQPGDRFRAGNDWLALVCGKSECHFEPARLSVRREKWQGHYDDEPTQGQKLTLRSLVSGPGTVVAWFRRNPAIAWLQPGPVVTYAALGWARKRPPGVGTLERLVDLPGGEAATLVPLFDRDERRFVLQLRTPGARQMLDELGSCSHEVSADYLVWAGDFDRDGRPDYLIDFADAVGAAKLYLGRDAGPGEIAGVAAAYEPPPFGGECDGDGWLSP